MASSGSSRSSAPVRFSPAAPDGARASSCFGVPSAPAVSWVSDARYRIWPSADAWEARNLRSRPVIRMILTRELRSSRCHRIPVTSICQPERLRKLPYQSLAC